MLKTSGLTVRQHEREGIEVPIEFAVCPAHDSQVRFSPSSSAASAGMVRGQAVDISSGGMGLHCRQFVPRMTEGTLRVFVPVPGKVQADGSPAQEMVFEHKVKVRRVFQLGREQMYSLGVAFVDPDLSIDRRIAALIERIQPNARLPRAAGSGGYRA